ncbi:MAG: ATP-grasp domain-containing protein [Gammaproteobacteria bacterium]|nr:ATP-grasp domain-containing protein [Gammaproteobacteria bacterium]
MSKQRLMILGGGVQQAALYRRALAMGLEVFGVDPDPRCACRALANGFHVADLRDESTLTEIARRIGIAGVVTVAADYPVQGLAAIVHALGLLGLSRETALACTDKARMRQTLNQAAIAIPDFQICEDRADVDTILQESPDGLVLKPTGGSGSKGVRFLHFGTPARDVSAAFQEAAAFSQSGQVLAEQYITGPEYSVEAVNVDGEPHVIAITRKQTSGPPHFVETGHDVPASLSAAESSAIQQCAKGAINSLGIVNGASHTEIIVDGGTPKIIEVAARLGGGYINSDLIPLATGVDMLGAAINVALGRTPDLSVTRNAGASIRFFQPRAGTVQKIDLRDAVEIPGAVKIDPILAVGDRVSELRDSRDRRGFVISMAANQIESARIAELVVSTVIIETTDP